MKAVENVNRFIEAQHLMEKYEKDLLPQRFGKAGKIWVALLIIICLLGVYAYFRQLKYGLSVTAMRDFVSWGIYISTGRTGKAFDEGS